MHRQIDNTHASSRIGHRCCHATRCGPHHTHPNANQKAHARNGVLPPVSSPCVNVNGCGWPRCLHNGFWLWLRFWFWFRLRWWGCGWFLHNRRDGGAGAAAGGWGWLVILLPGNVEHQGVEAGLEVLHSAECGGLLVHVPHVTHARRARTHMDTHAHTDVRRMTTPTVAHPVHSGHDTHARVQLQHCSITATTTPSRHAPD